MSDVVELAIPVQSNLLVLARLTAATLASRAELGIDEVEDLRLVVDELCLLTIGACTEGTLQLRYLLDDDGITIGCSLLDGRAAGMHAGGGAGGRSPTDDDGMSVQIIEALVDERGAEVVDGRLRHWVRKRGSRVAG